MRCIRAAHLSSGLWAGGVTSELSGVKRPHRYITKYGVHTHGLRDTRPSGPRGSSAGAARHRTPGTGHGTRAPAAGHPGLDVSLRGAWRLVIGTIIARPVSGSRTVRADDAPGARRARGGRVVWVRSLASSRTRHDRPATSSPAGAAGDPQTFTESDQHRHNAVQCGTGALYSRLDSAAPSQALGEWQCD